MSNKSASRSPASSDRHSSQSPAYPSGQHSPPSAGNEAASNPSKISLSPASAYPNHPSALHPNHRSSSPQPVYVIQSSTSGHHEAELPRDQNHSFAQQPAHLAQIPFYPSHPAANIGYPGVLAQPPSLQCPYPPHPGIDIFYLDATRPPTQSYPQPEHSAYQRYPGHQQSFQVPQGPGSNFPSAHYQSQGMFSGSHNLSFSDNTFIDNSITSDNFMKEFLQHTIIGAEFDSSDRHPPPRCHPGTRLAIVERCKVFILECDGKEKMRWVVGPAGVGKSAIMQIVAEEIPADASVFFSVNGRQDGNKTFTTIAYQLAAKYEPYRQFIRNEISCDPSLFRKSLPAQFQKFIIDPFIHRRLFGPSHRLLIILDGLDECDDLVTQGELLELISEFCIAYPSSPIVWFVTSRPEPHITSFFDDDRVASAYTKEQVAINSDEACEDVQLYLRDELNKIKRAYPTLRHKREWPSELEFTKIATAAGGLFAYASTVVRYIGDRHYRDPVARLRHILETVAATPKDETSGRDHPMAQLDALYERILSSIPADVMTNTRKLLLIYSNYGWDKEKFRSQCNRLALTEDAAYGAVSHLHAVVKVPTPDKADDECLTYFHKSFADFLFDFKRSGFCRNIAAEVAKIQAQSSLRIVEQVPDDFDGMASGERIKCSDYGYLKCGPGFCDNISLSWPGDERFLITDSQLRLDLYRNSMRNVGNKFSLSSKRSWNMACFHLLTMRFVVSGVWFPFYKLQTSVFDKFRSELKELGKLKQVPLRMLDFAAVCGKIDLRFTSPIGMDGKHSDPWNSSCKHEKYDVELDGLRPSRGWSTSFSRFLDGPRVAHTDTPQSSIKAGKGSHWKSIGHGGDNHRCLYCSRRIAHHTIQNPDQLATIFVDSTEMCYVELAFVDPDDGTPDKADTERLTYLHKSFKDFLFDSKRSRFSPDLRGEGEQLKAQCSLRIVEQVPDNFDGVARGEVIKCYDYGDLEGGPGLCDSVSLSWSGDECFQTADEQLRLDLYRNSMNDMCTTFSLRIEFAWNMSCFRALTTRFAAFNSLFPEMLIDDDVIAVMNTVSPPLRMANTVNIYLPIEGRQILLLSIPSIDIQRFSLYPVKWLRFVTFTICGVHGHLSVTPSGPPVNYNNISLDSIDENYYYNPDGDYNFIDHKAMDGRVISSMHTPHSSSFCDAIMERDGRVCVFTRNTETEAAHLLPKRKGDEYIQVVLQDRLHLYGPTVERSDLGINSVENGILLSMNLHSSFAHGECAFLKTPNFALDPADIPRVETGPIPSSRITLHLWIPDESLNPISQRDAQIAGTGIFPPSTVILDFIYGVTAYQCWGCGNDIKKVMQECFSNHYGSIPLAPPSPQQRERNRNLDVSDEMSRAMDDVLMLSMLLKGRTPESMAAERQRREEAAELCAKEASRAKVEQWMQSCSSHTGSGSKFQSNAASSDHENDLAI